jgi:hypothetical protein
MREGASAHSAQGEERGGRRKSKKKKEEKNGETEKNRNTKPRMPKHKDRSVFFNWRHI